MIEPKNFTIPEFKSDSENYDLLLEQGIALIQNYSGERWTDFNYHDPGITLLEQICYAITDLGYRTNFPIEDLLIGKKEGLDLEQTNLFFPIDKILPSKPLIPEDFQKLIIETIDEVKNAWVYPVNDSLLGFNGLLNVFVQCEEVNGIEFSEEELSQKVYSLLMKNRPLGADFQKIQILKKDELSIDAKLKIDSFVLGETILSEIYFQVEKILNPKIKLQDLESIRLNGTPIDEIFSGPTPLKGFIDSKDFALKTNEIYISEIREAIEKVEGVLEVEELFLFKNGIKVFEDLVTFGEDNYPFLKKNITTYNAAPEQIRLYRDNIFYQIDTIILSQLYDSLSISEKTNYYKSIKPQKIDLSGRFSKADIEQYYSIQNEFPAVYGLKENELPSKSDKKRIAQVKQLRGFLVLFEQLMANHLSQLSNFHQIFSIDSAIKNTFYRQYADEIPGLDELISFETEKEYLDHLNTISESKGDFFKRRTQIIDHLLARFGENFDTETLAKLLKIKSENSTDQEIKQTILNAKIRYAKNIVENGHNKGLGFNYKMDTWDTQNASGHEQRLKLLLGIDNTSFHSLTNPLVEDYEQVENEEKWISQILKVKGGANLEVLMNTDISNDNKEMHLNYFTSTHQDFRSLFTHAIKTKNYNVVSSAGNKTEFHLLYNAPGFQHPIELFRSDSEDKCNQAMVKGIEKFEHLNVACEGMFLVEHILLRPLLTTNYITTFLNNDSEPCLVSYNATSFEEQNDLRNDIFILGTNKENYSIIKSKEKKEYQIVIFDIFNKPVFKCPKVLYSNTGAKSEMKRLLEYFVKKSEEKDPIENFSEIIIDKGNSHEFPTDFGYSNQLSFIFPDWPLRFQNTEFRAYLKSSIQEHIPAHFSYDLFYLNVNQLSLFEDTYFNWLDKKKSDDDNEADVNALQLIQLLRSYKP